MHSVIPIFYSELGDLQVATDASAQLLQDCINAFEDAAEKLLRTYGEDEDVATQLRQMIEGCREYCTGNVAWR